MIAAFMMVLAMQHWLVINDIHLDPFSRAGVIAGRDTTPDLWKLSVAEMHKAVPHPKVVLLGGDELAHHFADLARRAHKQPEPAVLALDRRIADDLNAIYPDAQFLVTQGNNDDPCGDYKSETNGAFERQLGRIWEPLVNRHGAAPGFVAQFERGGYYETRLPVHGGRAIVLNSVFWSFVYSGGCLSTPHQPGGQEFTWLNRTLAALPNDANVVMLMHVPAGYDPESTMVAHRILAVPFLNGGADRSFLNAVGAHKNVIREIIAAHTHRYDFRVASGVPMLIASSISPIYGNNPAFYDLTVDDRGAILDIVPYAYHLDEGAFEREPGFREMYGIPAFDSASLQSVADRIRRDQRTRDVWKAAYDVWSYSEGEMERDWVPFSCAQTELGSGFSRCAQTTHRTEALEGVVGAAAAFVLLLAGFWIVRARRARARRSR